MKIGSHVSNKGKEMLVGAVKEAISYDANCFMIYLGAPQNSYRKSLKDFQIELFKDYLLQYEIDIKDVIVHAPYIINLAQPNKEKRQFAIDFITEEVKRTHIIGAKYFVLHPGSTLNLGLEEGLNIIANSLKEILFNTKETNVFILIETMAGKGTEACFRFEHIKRIIDIVGNSRLQVCFDTCHTFDSGYDLINDYEGVIENFDQIIGLENLKVIHLNDSKNNLGSRKDRHENIGFGKIGFEPLLKVFEDTRFTNIPKILETPYLKFEKNQYPPYKEEIKMLREKKFNPNLYNDVEKYYKLKNH